MTPITRDPLLSRPNKISKSERQREKYICAHFNIGVIQHSVLWRFKRPESRGYRLLKVVGNLRKMRADTRSLKTDPRQRNYMSRNFYQLAAPRQIVMAPLTQQSTQLRPPPWWSARSSHESHQAGTFNRIYAVYLVKFSPEEAESSGISQAW
jgi:hypothetical protein